MPAQHFNRKRPTQHVQNRMNFFRTFAPNRKNIKMKGVLKVSKEQVIEIERYCDEHGITRRQRIDELGLNCTAYYYTRGLLSKEELHGGQFIPIMSGSGLMQTVSMPVGRSRRKQGSVQTELLTIEVRTSSGVEMCLTGNFSAEMLRTILVNV